LLLGVNLYKRKNFKFFFGLPETRTEKKLDKFWRSCRIMTVTIQLLMQADGLILMLFALTNAVTAVNYGLITLS